MGAGIGVQGLKAKTRQTNHALGYTAISYARNNPHSQQVIKI
jgi:ABC-type phosphate transport system substrate-binding protein